MSLPGPRALWQRMRPRPPAPEQANGPAGGDPAPRAPERATAGADREVREALDGLAKQVGRAGREQLKANALAEAQAEQLRAALDALREAEARRDRDAVSLRERAAEERTAARTEVALALLPALDGLDEAIRSGRRILEDAAGPPPARRLFGRPRGAQVSRDALDSRLVGLGFVRQRLLDVLAAEGVRPVEAEGRPFDPRRHVAVEVVPARRALPPGTVAAEVRRGYAAGDRVVRHAEVAVARSKDQT